MNSKKSTSKKNVHITYFTHGIFWMAPVVIIIAVVVWLGGKLMNLITASWSLVVGFITTILGVEQGMAFYLILILSGLILITMIYFLGSYESTVKKFLEKILKKIPGFEVVQTLVNMFNPSTTNNQIIVVAIKGFSEYGYNIGLMYSQEESIHANHYTVTLSQSPIPNGGFVFEVHEDHIEVIEGAGFEHNLTYLTSMGAKTFTEILGSGKVKLISFKEYKTKNAL